MGNCTSNKNNNTNISNNTNSADNNNANDDTQWDAFRFKPEQINVSQFNNAMFTLGNHCYYGMFPESFAFRCNELLRVTFCLLEFPDLSEEHKQKLRYRQYWLIGFMDSRCLQVRPEIQTAMTRDSCEEGHRMWGVERG